MWKMIISGEGLCNIFKEFRHVSSQFRGKSITISVNWRKAKDSDKKHYFMLQLTFFLNNLGIYSWCKASKSPLDRNVSWLNPLIPHLIAFFLGGRAVFSHPVQNGACDWLAACLNCLPTFMPDRAVMCSSASSTMDWKKRKRSGIEYKFGGRTAERLMLFFLQSCWQVQSRESAGSLGQLFNLLRLNTAPLPCPSRFAALFSCTWAGTAFSCWRDLRALRPPHCFYLLFYATCSVFGIYNFHVQDIWGLISFFFTF